MPRPFSGREFVFTQPDGTSIRVRGWGDQYHAVFESLDGFTVVKDPASGFYHYAKLSEDENDLVPSGRRVEEVDPRSLGLAAHMRMRREATREKALVAARPMGFRRRWEIRREERKARIRETVRSKGPAAAPPPQETKGDYVGLCLLIQFPDVAGTITQQQVDDFCNTQGYTGFGNHGSVYDYFYDVSGGLFRYTNVVAAYYTAAHNRSYYTDPSVSFGSRARELILEALQHLSDENFDFGSLSSDASGFVYALNVFYAGGCPNNWGEGLWPHSWGLASPYEAAPGMKFSDYQITDMGSQLSLGTFCHENGHMVCDFPDLYDYGYESRGVGDYCLMAFGGGDEKNPTQVGAYLKYNAGWAQNLTPITPGMDAAISALSNDFYIHQRSAEEYFIIENRRRQDRDAALPDAGLAIWHVDEAGSNNDEQMTAARHYECSLEQADNHCDLEHNANTGDGGDLFGAPENDRFADSTTPNSKWWDGTPSGLDVYEISAPGDTMTFKTPSATVEVVRTLRKGAKPKLKIPDNLLKGVRDTLKFPESAVLRGIKVGVDITHPRPRDLRVALIAPWGTRIVLFDRLLVGSKNLRTTFDVASTPALAALRGQFVKGNWALQVSDLAAGETGTLNAWGLEIRAVVVSTLALRESPHVIIPDHVPTGIERNRETRSAGVVKELAVSVDITHPSISDLTLALAAPSGKTVMLHNRGSGFGDRISETYTEATTPGLSTFIGQPVGGEWKLKVADHVGVGEGKLNRWAVEIALQP
jgi:M6 family metalloprotease-like protein